MKVGVTIPVSGMNVNVGMSMGNADSSQNQQNGGNAGNNTNNEMNIHTPSAHVKSATGFETAITAATVNGASTDCLGYHDAKAIFRANPSGAGTTSDCKLQESSDNAAWADVATASFSQVTTAGGAKLQVMDIKLGRRSRYLRLVHTSAGGAAAGVAYGLIELYNARYSPVSQDNPAKSV